MFNRIITATLNGIDACVINVETDVQPGLPYMNLVGLADKTIKEARERVRAAIVNSGFEYPKRRITVNLSPAGLPKEGSHFDLPIAVGILTEPLHWLNISQFGLIGELSLDGKVKGVRGALPLVIGMREAGIRKFIIPADNAEEVAILTDVEIYPVTNLKDCVYFLAERHEIAAYKRKENEGCYPCDDVLDFADVKGNENAKRALVIAAAGNHGILMMGPPGCGKTMMAKRVPYIMPDMDYGEKLEVAKIHSVAGNLDAEYIMSGRRPFRAPHYTITKTALVGGGVPIRPGEITLAHNGVLFLDEYGEFDPAVIELLRQPVEEGTVSISRVRNEAVFPCRMMMVAAANPCKCGYNGDVTHICTCTQRQLESYCSRFSGPMMDRIDMHVTANPVKLQEVSSEMTGMSTEEMKNMVNTAVEQQNKRYENTGIHYNGRLDEKDVKQFCLLEKGAKEFLDTAFETYGMSMRTYNKVLKVSRTIADLEKSQYIKEGHVTEALRYKIQNMFNRR